MKKHLEVIQSELNPLRAGIISSLILTLCWIYATGLSSLPRIGLFIVAFAICFVLMMKSVVDLFVWTFNFAMRFSGVGLGRGFKLVRRIRRE